MGVYQSPKESEPPVRIGPQRRVGPERLELVRRQGLCVGADLFNGVYGIQLVAAPVDEEAAPPFGMAGIV